MPPDDVDVTALLDLARDAAHSIDRTAAPVTTFVVGYAAAQRGGGTEAVGAAHDRGGSPGPQLDLVAEHVSVPREHTGGDVAGVR